MSSMTETPKEDDEAIIRRLANLPQLDYDRTRKEQSKTMGVRASLLDKLVSAERKEIAKSKKIEDVVEEIEPWERPVDGAALLEEMEAALDRHVILPNGGHIAIPLWALSSYCMDAWSLFPKLLITSPEKRCGKTVLLESLECIVSRALLTSNISPSAIFRCIEEWAPTLMMDEADTYTKDNDELNGVINAGHKRRAAVVIRTEKVDGIFKPTKFSVWCPQVIAGIGEQRGTLHDRSIHIEMRRKMPGEKVRKLPVDSYEQQMDIRRRCLRWADDNIQKLRTSRVQVPECGNDRAQDNWMPLFAIAQIVGGSWPEKVKSAYLIFSESMNSASDSAGVMLLTDIKEIFDSRASDKIFSEDLVSALIALEDRPWFEWKRGKPLTQNSLSRLLKPYHGKPGTVRIGNMTKKGYYRADLEDAFTRYLSDSGIQSVTPSQVNSHAGFKPTQPPNIGESVTVPKRHNQSVTDAKHHKNGGFDDETPRKPIRDAGCDGVTVQSVTGEGARELFEEPMKKERL